MKVLVTGGAGFVGTNLIKRLLKDGHEVVSLDNYSTGKKENEQDGCKYIEVDISDSLRRHKGFGLETYQLEKPDIIFHLAALARIQPSFDKPTETFDVNARGTINLLNWARLNGNIPVVYAGSSSSHGDKHANPYTFSKWQGELLCEMFYKVYNLPTVITRFYNVYGEYQILDGAYAAVIGIFEKQYRDGTPLTITGDGEQRRDFTHVDDIVDGLVKCGRALRIPNEYNVGPEHISGKTLELGRGENYSINEIANFYGVPTKHIEERPGEMRVTLCESREARVMLGFNPTINIKDYIETWIQNEN